MSVAPPPRPAWTALVLSAAITGCVGPIPPTNESIPGHPGGVTPGASASDIAARVCSGREGSVVDVATEPDWRQFSDYRQWWTAEGGCLIRIDVLADRPGPEHCGYESSRVIITGIPFGARYSNQRDAAEFVRDPDNVLGDAATSNAFDPDVQLPERAQDTGFRTIDTQLWVDPTDGSSIYLVLGDRVERWPRDPTPTICS